jgi:transposase-like protein
MARNSVQFQKGLSEVRFDELYGSEDRCREAVFAWRWPHGFVCPGCGGQHHCVIKTRGLYQCTSCRRQTSLIAGTIFASTKVPLRTWFRAMYQLTQSKGGISSLELGRRLGATIAISLCRGRNITATSAPTPCRPASRPIPRPSSLI